MPLQIKGDERGSLIAIEAGVQVPFLIARIYFIFGTQPNVTRGLHAHRSLQQLIVPTSGSFRLVLDDGNTRTAVKMDNPSKGLLIRSPIWREMSEFSADCVLLVMADAPYDPDDYIRDYKVFKKFVRNLIS